MTQLVIQYVLIVLLVVGLAYFVYLLKDKGLNINEDYFGVANTLLSFLGNKATSEDSKQVLRAISQAVNYVETNYKEEDNEVKEQKAVVLVTEALDAFNFEKSIPDDRLKQIIRLCVGFMPPTHKKKTD